MYIDNGMTKTDAPHWAGGEGAMMHYNISINETPEYDGRDPDAQEDKSEEEAVPAKAWVVNSSYAITVTAWYIGTTAGDHGAWYLTAGAADRSNAHEQDHMVDNKQCHDNHLVLLENRCAQHEAELKARPGGANRAESIALLTTFVDWPASVQAFCLCDTAKAAARHAAYTPSVDHGPREVNGIAYDHFVDAPRTR